MACGRWECQNGCPTDKGDYVQHATLQLRLLSGTAHTDVSLMSDYGWRSKPARNYHRVLDAPNIAPSPTGEASVMSLIDASCRVDNVPE